MASKIHNIALTSRFDSPRNLEETWSRYVLL